MEKGKPVKTARPGRSDFDPSAYHHRPGWEHFTPDASAEMTMQCQVCNAEMDVERMKYGATSRGEAMAKKKHYYDEFSCPHAENKWHQQVLALRIAIKETPSSFVAIMLESGNDHILENKEPTKEDWKYIF